MAGAGLAARGRDRAAADDEAERVGSAPSPRVGTARLRDASSTGGRASAGGDRGREGVGFSDGTSEQDRFRPPT